MRRSHPLSRQAVEDARSDRRKLWLGTSGADHEGFGDRGEAGHVEDDDVRGLLVFGEERNPPRKIVWFDVALRWGHPFSLPESSGCRIHGNVVRFDRSLQHELGAIEVETALLDVFGDGVRNEVAQRASARSERSQLTARMREVEAI